MSITFVRNGNPEVAYFDEHCPTLEILIFDPVEERGQLSLGDRFRSLDPSLQNADVTIFRSSSSSTRDAMLSDAVLNSMLGSRTVLHLGRSNDPSSPSIALSPIFGEDLSSEIPMAEVQQAELLTLLRLNGAVHEANNHHYLLPSGWHSDKFVRIGNACCSVVDNRRLADWLLGHVTEHTDLLADTGSILPLLQEVQRHCQHRFGWRTKIDALPQYPSIDVLVEGVNDLRARSEGKRGIAFVVSVNSSGGSQRRFGSMVASPSLDSTVVICETDPLATQRRDTLTRLPAKRWLPDSSGKCEACGSPAAVVVHPMTYEPNATYEIRRTAVTPAKAKSSAALFQTLSSNGAVRLHYDSDRGAHYAVWVDTPKLLEDSACFGEFVSHIANLDPADVVLVPKGPAEAQLAAVARSATQSEPYVVAQASAFEPDVMAAIEAADRVLIVDDTIVSGTTLARIRREVYNAAQLVGRNPHISAAAFLARPSRKSVLQRVSRPYMTESGGNIEALHQVLLPEGPECSFCRERLLLRSWYERLSPDARAVANERLTVLDTEMTADLFLGSSSSAPSLVEAGGLLTAGSFFGELSEIGGFAAASSSVQTVLDELGTMRGALSAHIVDIAAALDAYFDPCLLVGILRTATKEEVRFATEDAEIISRYGALAEFGEALTDAVRCEIGWAALREVVPLIGVKKIVEPVVTPDGLLVRELLALRESS